MVTFRPFNGYLPRLGDDEGIDERVSPPYDVIGEEELKRLHSNPYNVTRITLGSKDGRYLEARAELDSWIADGRLAMDDEPCFYLYQQRFPAEGGELVRTGIIGRMKAEAYSEGNIIPHEETFSKVKEDRLNLLRDIETHCESIFGIFEGLSEELREKLEDAQLVFLNVDGQGVEHALLRISDPATVEGISRELEESRVMIADGHHRFETAVNFASENPENEKKQYVMATLVAADDEGLVIWPTHRLVRGSGKTEEEIIDSLSATMDLEDVGDPFTMGQRLARSKRTEIGLMFPSGRCLLASANALDDDPLWELDTYVAQELVLRGLFGYGESDVVVDYDAEATSVSKKLAEGGYDLAIMFDPPRMETIWSIAARGRRMPKKSTYFFPKIWSGFVYYRML
jgi:uncharacterized protein (DUF1015 family)